MDDKKTNAKEDHRLVYLWARGEPEGFEKLYKKYNHRIFGFLIKMTRDRNLAEELMQETFFAAYSNIRQYDSERSFLSWLFGIAHKKTIDYYRHVRVERENWSEAGRALTNDFDRPDDFTYGQELKNLINDVIIKLERNQREVLLLRVLGDVKFREIAEIMDCPLNTVLGRMFQALRKIRKELEKEMLFVNS